MVKLIRILRKYLFSEELPMEIRTINMIYLLGLITSFATLLNRVVIGGNHFLVYIILAIFLSLAIMMAICNRFHLYDLCTILMVNLLFNILFPMLFFALGGLNSAMPAYFVLSIMVIFLLLQGKMRVIILATHLLITGLCYFLSTVPYFQRIIADSNPNLNVRDHLLSIMIVGICIGSISVFQRRIYKEEKRKSDLANETLATQDHLLQTVNKVAETLLASEPGQLTATLQQAMAMMAGCIDADRIYIWKRESVNHKIYYVQQYEWLKENIFQEYTLLSQTGSRQLEGITEWETKFARGESVNGPVASLSTLEQDWLHPFAIRSILVLPIVLQENFWGFISFDDCRCERSFTEDEIDILHSGSLMIASAIVRSEITSELIRAREDALSSSKAKGDFLSNMSHEIRTPMNAIIGMTAIGKDTSNADRKDYAFGKIEDASTHLLGVINDILDMSKIEANKFDLSATDFHFERMLRKVVGVINFRVDEKRQRLTVHVDENTPHSLIGDEQRLAQVITNLLSNAVKFTPEGGSIRLHAEMIGEENNVCTIRITVTDTGIGISQEQQRRLFRSFEQAESSTSRKYGGTGLGLSISKHIVEMMGGEIGVESIPGRGSSFFFTANLTRGRKAHQNLLDPNVNWTNIRLLVVDDEEDIRTYFAEVAKSFEIACDTAASGAEALAFIEGGARYDLYFIDWKMPGIDGIQLTRKLKELNRNQSVCIMISSMEWSDIEKEAGQAGVDKFLPKPLFPSAIADLINECIASGAVHAAEHCAAAVPDYTGRKALLAEDVDINREIVLTMLEPTGLAVDTAENGAEAVRLYQASPESYHIIFMDIQMPEMDGYEATKRIRVTNAPGAISIPIVAMTANVFREDVERCLAAGMNDHIGKPINYDEVVAVLGRYL